MSNLDFDNSIEKSIRGYEDILEEVRNVEFETQTTLEQVFMKEVPIM